jgi:hypothetical protein
MFLQNPVCVSSLVWHIFQFSENRLQLKTHSTFLQEQIKSDSTTLYEEVVIVVQLWSDLISWHRI